MHDATGHFAASATALLSAAVSSRDFIRESIEYPTMRLENTSLIAHR